MHKLHPLTYLILLKQSWPVNCITHKIQLIEKIFENRRQGYLLHGDYDYDSTDDNDSLNNRESIEDILKQLDCYHLYQQQVYSGIFLVLAKSYCLVEHKNEG